MEIIFGAILNN